MKLYEKKVVIEKEWKKPYVITIIKKELSLYIKAAARSGCPGGAVSR